MNINIKNPVKLFDLKVARQDFGLSTLKVFN